MRVKNVIGFFSSEFVGKSFFFANSGNFHELGNIFYRLSNFAYFQFWNINLFLFLNYYYYNFNITTVPEKIFF